MSEPRAAASAASLPCAVATRSANGASDSRSAKSGGASSSVRAGRARLRADQRDAHALGELEAQRTRPDERLDDIGDLAVEQVPEEVAADTRARLQDRPLARELERAHDRRLLDEHDIERRGRVAQRDAEVAEPLAAGRDVAHEQPLVGGGGLAGIQPRGHPPLQRRPGRAAGRHRAAAGVERRDVGVEQARDALDELGQRDALEHEPHELVVHLGGAAQHLVLGLKAPVRLAQALDGEPLRFVQAGVLDRDRREVREPRQRLDVGLAVGGGRAAPAHRDADRVPAHPHRRAERRARAVGVRDVGEVARDPRVGVVVVDADRAALLVDLARHPLPAADDEPRRADGAMPGARLHPHDLARLVGEQDARDVGVRRRHDGVEHRQQGRVELERAEDVRGDLVEDARISSIHRNHGTHKGNLTMFRCSLKDKRIAMLCLRERTSRRPRARTLPRGTLSAGGHDHF